MNKNFIIIAIIAVLLGVGAAVLMAMRDGNVNDADQPTETQQPAGPLGEGEQTENEANGTTAGNTVTYTSDGFSPADLIVRAGDTVEFVNESNTNFWVASDPHPTHTDLPNFDSERGLQPGESYTFTFDETGEWGFHNHLAPQQFGTIIVE